MSRVTELEKALTTLFRKGTEVGYTETEIDEFLENIDYHALLQAVWNKAETVYAYRADGKNALSLDYRSAELFKQRATLLYEDVGDSYIGAVFAARSMELWLLEDMGFAVVAKFSVNAGEGEFRVTPQEREMIETKMAQFGTTNMAAYLRKMAIDGYVVKLDLPELRELVSLLRYSSNNLNQLTRRAHETGRIYEADWEDIQQSQERIWTAAEKIVSSLAALK